MLTKICSGGFCKGLDDKGEGVARIAMLGPPPDRDGDVLEPGVLGGEQTVPLLTGHDWGRVPIGKVRAFEATGELLAAFKINMAMGRGRELHAALQFDLQNPPPRQEWSFGYLVKDAEPGVHEGQRIRRLRRVELIEVSPVIKGAGRETATLALKSNQDLAAEMARAATQFAALQARVEQYDREREAAEKTLKPFRFLDPVYRTKQVAFGRRIIEAAAGTADFALKLYLPAAPFEAVDFRDADVLGRCNRPTKKIDIRADLSDVDFISTALHEAGHLRGLDEPAAVAFAARELPKWLKEFGIGDATHWPAWEQAQALVWSLRMKGYSQAEISKMFAA